MRLFSCQNLLSEQVCVGGSLSLCLRDCLFYEGIRIFICECKREIDSESKRW